MLLILANPSWSNFAFLLGSVCWYKECGLWFITCVYWFVWQFPTTSAYVFLPVSLPTMNVFFSSSSFEEVNFISLSDVFFFGLTLTFFKA